MNHSSSVPAQRARPHDLLFIGVEQSFITESPLPEWADRHWLNWAPAVVRRAAPAMPGGIPVGLRGHTRSQRCAAWIHERDVAALITPESLTQARTWQQYRDWGEYASISALQILAPRLEGRAWGITGSVGFSLASGIRLLTQVSDLDLLIRQTEPMSRAEARAILRLTEDLPCRCDIQIETPSGAFALFEWARDTPLVLVKNDHGPRLTSSPWAISCEGTTP